MVATGILCETTATVLISPPSEAYAAPVTASPHRAATQGAVAAQILSSSMQ